MNRNSSLPGPQPINIIAVSLAYPPLAYPRSIQVARLLKFVNASTVLFCCDEHKARTDPTIEPDAEKIVDMCVRVPFRIAPSWKFIDRFSYRYHRPFWNRRNLAPDNYGSWGTAVIDKIKTLIGSTQTPPDAIVTFAQPFTDHLIGLEIKKSCGLPWLAHFSDPWVDNPYNRYDEKTRELNLELERQVVENAESLVFTSQETIDLVMRKYPPAFARKASVIPQSFDASLFSSETTVRPEKITIRYVGNLYGERTAEPLIAALRSIVDTDANKLDGVCIELVGISDNNVIRNAGGGELPDGLLSVYPSVAYRESLRLMSAADGLLIVDAPAEISVFLPSKLIDYIGAGRPIFGITPPGTAEKLIRSLGGSVAPPSDTDALAKKLLDFINLLRARRRSGPIEVWGDPEIRKNFEVREVAVSFEEILRSIAAGNG